MTRWSRRVTPHVAIWVRLVGAAAVLAALASVENAPIVQGAFLSVGYLLATIIVRLLAPNRPLEIALGVTDLVLLQWVTYATGGLDGPGPFLLVLHAAAASLAGRQRAGVWVALVHGVALLLVQELVAAEVLATPPLVNEDPLLVWIISATWLTAIATGTLSSLNERDLRNHRVDLEAQAELATGLASASDADEVNHVLLDHIDEMFDRPRMVLIGTPPGTHPTILARRRAPNVPPPSEGVRPASVLRRSAEQRRTLLVRDLDPVDDQWLEELLPGARNLALVPLVAEGRTVAVLMTEHGNRPGTSLEHRAVVAIERAADHAALALTSVLLRAALTQHALTDVLTGVANRRAFDEELERQLAQADRRSGQVSMMLVDLDHFKMLNDEHGHAVGDDVLSRVGIGLREVVRPIDTVARYGGEEFAVILPETSTDEAMVVAERVRERIAEIRTNHGVGVTASAGVATITASEGLDPRRLIRESDTALYAAKAAGRNCIRDHRGLGYDDTSVSTTDRDTPATTTA